MITQLTIFTLFLIAYRLFTSAWLIDALVCSLLLHVGILFLLYHVYGSAVLILITIIYVGVILLLVFLTGFMIDMSIDRLASSNSSFQYIIYLFIFLAVTIFEFDNLYTSSLLLPSSVTPVLSKSIELHYLWSSILVITSLPMLAILITMLSVLLVVLLTLNIRTINF